MVRGLITALLAACTFTNALQLPNLQPFLAAVTPLLDDFSPFAQSNGSTTEHELLKRQSNGCPSNWNSCSNLGAAGLCCAPNARCSADAAGHVACCQSSAVCTGTIGGYITAGTVDGNGNQVGGAGAVTGASTAATIASSTYVLATTTTTAVAGTTTQGVLTTGNGFIIASGSPVATPGRAARGVEIPLVIQGLQRALQFFI